MSLTLIKRYGDVRLRGQSGIREDDTALYVTTVGERFRYAGLPVCYLSVNHTPQLFGFMMFLVYCEALLTENRNVEYASPAGCHILDDNGPTVR